METSHGTRHTSLAARHSDSDHYPACPVLALNGASNTHWAARLLRRGGRWRTPFGDWSSLLGGLLFENCQHGASGPKNKKCEVRDQVMPARRGARLEAR